MDVFTQGVIGAAATQSVANKEEIRRASIIGFLSGLLADADVLINSSSDPMLVLEYHRHFTHSLFFIPFGALIACLLLWPFFRKTLTVKRLYLYCLAGGMFSGFIDTCTSYGTHLLWPFTNERFAWHIISIVDPLFTLGLVVAVVIAFRKKLNRAARYGFIFAGCYLLAGVMQLHRAETVIHELADSRGHTIEKKMVKPTIGNLVLWRSVYLADDTFYIDAARVGLSAKVFEGTSIRRFIPEQDLALIEQTSVLANDIRRFEFFSDGYVSFFPGKDNILGDVRYAMSPLSPIPLWGIVMDYSRPQEHVRYEFFRQVSEEERQQFVDMLFDK